MILEDMEVFAALMMHSLPRSSTFTVKFSLMYLQASLEREGGEIERERVKQQSHILH
jgi:hypothetical protein